MKGCSWGFRNRALSIGGVAILLAVITAYAVPQPAEVVVQGVNGSASCTLSGKMQPLKAGMRISPQGGTITTGPETTVDLFLDSSSTVLRLLPNTSLRFDRLVREDAGELFVTETSLMLLSGSVVGAQRKLAPASAFKINTLNGEAQIVGTEYVVRADGAVSCLSGQISVRYNLPGNKGSIQVSVAAGFTFDPSTGQVVATTAAYLQNLIAHINTVKMNAEVFKVGKATIIVKPERPVSPVMGNHQGNQDDQGGQGDLAGNKGPGGDGNSSGGLRQNAP